MLVSLKTVSADIFAHFRAIAFSFLAAAGITGSVYMTLPRGGGVIVAESVVKQRR